MLTDRVVSLARQFWSPVFAQARTLDRAVQCGLSAAVALGRRTITNAILARGKPDQDWSADYKLFSRSEWSSEELFDATLVSFLKRYPEGVVPIALDDTRLRKTGRKIPRAFWQRDPLSPPFRVNLMWGLRFLQASVLFPHHREGDLPARGVPVAFQEAPALRKPSARASAEEHEQYRSEARLYNLSTQALAVIGQLRSRADHLGAGDRTIVIAADGSFCNRTIFRAQLERVHIIARARKDARLCYPAPAGSRRSYEQITFTPEQVRLDESVPFASATFMVGSGRHEVRFKDIHHVLWRRGGGRTPLRLIVLAGQPYRLKSGLGASRREHAYLLTTDLMSSVEHLIQVYLDRWQIEINHRDEKDVLGVGQAQVWSEKSVPRQPAFMVALYALLLLAALAEFGPGRTSDFAPLAKWRRAAMRPSLLDLLTLLRRELSDKQATAPIWEISQRNLLLAAHT